MRLSDKTLCLMKELTEASGVSGHEKYITRILKQYYEKYCDEIIYDNLGSIYGIKRSKAPDAFNVMLAAHCDEIGMIVKGVNQNGTLKIAPVGGIWEESMGFTTVIVTNNSGEQFKGCICSPRNPSSTVAYKLADMVCDIGFTNAEDVRAHGIMEGDMVSFDTKFTVLGDGKRLMAKAWDDRYGCIAGIEILETFKDIELPFNLIVGADVQEEVGLKGAVTASNLVKPDLAIVFECTGCSDLKGYTSPNGALGKGTLLRFVDKNYRVNRNLLLDYKHIMDEQGIPYQWKQAAGSSDAGEINVYGIGVPVLNSCISARNIHSRALILDADDYIASREGAIAFLKELNRAKLEYYHSSNR